MIPLEIERKFLILKDSVPDEKCSEIIDIRQIYLVRPDKNIQRRVRSMSINGDTKYYYTEKRFISAAVREENESEITEERFNKLLAEADANLTPIEKTRKILVFEGQHFEIDCYPFSDKYASMELELANEKQDIFFPPFVSIIKEVTGDPAYSNANLANNGRFPDEAQD